MGMPELLRKALSRGAIATLSSARSRLATRLHRVGAKAVGAPLALLPVSTAAQVKGNFCPRVRLDYARSELWLHADGQTDLMRARACAKEPETVEWLERSLKPGDVVYDIGANVGAYSLIASRQAGGDVVVHAFEPSFATYNQLCRNVILNQCARVYPHMIALSGCTGASVFHYHSIEAGSALHSLGEPVDFQGAVYDPVYLQHVITFSIDDLVSTFGFTPPTVLKLDVDGLEFGILEGAGQVLSLPSVRTLMVEVPNAHGELLRFRDLLFRHGFVLAQRFDHPGGGNIVANLLFERPRRAQFI
jgi:FkbM family methyltransferase